MKGSVRAWRYPLPYALCPFPLWSSSFFFFFIIQVGRTKMEDQREQAALLASHRWDRIPLP